MPVLDRPRPIPHGPHEKRPAVITASFLELLSRNFARAAVRLRLAGHSEVREEYLAFVETVGILHDRAALEDLSASDDDERAGRLYDLHDVRAELELGSSPADGDGEGRP
jgi:hypothetical protein